MSLGTEQVEVSLLSTGVNMPEGVVVLLALVAAVFSALGIVLRQRATIEVPHEQGVSTTMVSTLLRKPLWWGGTAVAASGYGFQALALTWGELILVQPLLVSCLLFALPLSARLAHRRVAPREWAWALLLTVALAVFVLVAQVQPGDFQARGPGWPLVIAVGVPLVVACVMVGARSQGRQRALLLAVAVGVLFGVLAVLTKLSMHRLADGGLPSMLAVPAPYFVVALGVAATLVQQSAFHAGALQTSVPTMLVVEPMVAVALGVLLLGENLTVTGPATAALPVAVVAMVVSTIALGREEGAYEEELETR